MGSTPLSDLLVHATTTAAEFFCNSRALNQLLYIEEPLYSQATLPGQADMPVPIKLLDAFLFRPLLGGEPGALARHRLSACMLKGIRNNA